MSGAASQTPQVLRAPKLFWQTRRLDGHRNWPFAFWRELFQNSVDAGAKEIDIRISGVPRAGSFGRPSDGGQVVRVVFTDDGTGMTEDTIRNVFLEPGRSTKTMGESVGGFGTARTLLCFSQDRYEIHTNGLVVEGDGSEYILARASEALAREGDASFHQRVREFADRKGCTFVIDIDPHETEYSWRNVSEEKLRQELFDFIDMSELGLREVRLNGGLVEGGLKKGPARTRLSAPGYEDFASVHLARGDRATFQGYAIVRVKGLAMFRERSGAEDTQVILELDPKRTRMLLTDSRDELKDKPDQALRSFISDLATNRREALRDRDGDKALTLDGELGDVKAEPEPIEIVGVRGVARPEDAGKVPVAEGGGARVTSTGSPSPSPASTAAPRADAIPGMHDFHLHTEGIKGNPVLENAARRWQPKYWRRQGESLAGRGRESHELLAAWTAACTHALGVIGSLRPQLLKGAGHIPFVPGFVIAGGRTDVDGITHRLGGLHKFLPDGRHALLVNPILDDGSIAYSLKQLRDGDGKYGIQRLVHVAIHEACHVIGNSHDERFANLLTTVSASIDYAKLAKSMLEQINSVRALYGAKEARIQAFERMAELGLAVGLEEIDTTPNPRRRREPRPAAKGLAVAYPVAAPVLGVAAAPENTGLPLDAARATLAAAIEPRSETETAIHTEILGRIDQRLAEAARNNWDPPSVDWTGFDPDAPPETAEPEALKQDQPDALEIDFSRVDFASVSPEELLAPVSASQEPLDAPRQAASAPVSEPLSGMAADASTGEDKTVNEMAEDISFPPPVSIYDIIGSEDVLKGDVRDNTSEMGYRP